MARWLLGGAAMLAVLVGVGIEDAFAQAPTHASVAGSTAERSSSGDEEQASGFSVPDSDRLRVSLRGMAGYGFEPANEGEGRGRYGRVGHFIIDVRGRLSPRWSYFASINPVNEVAPLPSCGEPLMFFPNDPLFLGQDLYDQGIGPNVGCHPDGRRRVDMYRGVALDVVDQQGPVRELWLNARLGRGFDATFGRMMLPIGFNWQDAGSMTAKDAPMIQRINAEANFGVLLRHRLDRSGRPLLTVSVGGVIGEGNAWKDYAYQFFQDPAMDGNTDLTAVASVVVSPVEDATLMVSYKGGYTGSKIERFGSSYWGGGKHNDKALVVSGQYRIDRHNRVLAECARYTWGLAETSAIMVGSNPDPVLKTGCYVTVEGGMQVRPGIIIGGSFTREEIDRADSLIRYLSEQAWLGVEEGKTDRMSVIRVFVDLHDRVRLGYFFNDVSNPYPWVSGIYPSEGPNAFTGRQMDRWGVVVSFRLQ